MTFAAGDRVLFKSGLGPTGGLATVTCARTVYDEDIAFLRYKIELDGGTVLSAVGEAELRPLRDVMIEEFARLSANDRAAVLASLNYLES